MSHHIPTTILPFILSGGAGTRLWPLSRESYPKQLIALVGGQTMIQETALRVADSRRFHAPAIICNTDHRFMINEQINDVGINPSAMLIEPRARNTAAAVAIAALHANALHPQQLLLIMPADHVIADLSAFAAAIEQGRALAESGKIVTFGIIPDRAETAYGYLKQGEALSAQSYAVAQFVEKPNRTTAENYLHSGQYYWNSGIFFARADVLLAEFDLHAPELLMSMLQAYQHQQPLQHNTRLGIEGYNSAPALQFDKAVMEKTALAAVVPVQMGWSDIGTWHSLWESSARDAAGNVLLGDVLAQDCENCYIRSEHQLTAVLGLKDAVLVVTEDAVMATSRARASDLSQLVEQLRRLKRDETKQHKVVHRPWGSYHTISLGDRFQVKSITVKPAGRLSLQKHFHRAEHWTVVQGTAQVTVGEEVKLLTENESIFIPLGAVHRLENLGRIPLTLIEVQSGSYVGEDDIVRLEDIYARA